MKSITKLLLFSQMGGGEALKTNVNQKGGSYVDELAKIIVDLNTNSI